MRRLVAMLVAGGMFAAAAFAQQKETPMTHHARGTFAVEMKPLTQPIDGLSRFSMDKQIHGDPEATSKGEMLSGGDYKRGAAGYVAIEMVTGTLAAKHGTFALQQMATMDASGLSLNVVVVPGSGTGELKGIAGTYTIVIADGKHSYDLGYTLPD